MRVNERLKNYIEHIGIKQRVIAEKTGFSENKVSQTLNGRRVINDIYHFNGN